MSVVVVGQRLGSWEMVTGSTAREVVLPWAQGQEVGKWAGVMAGSKI